MGDPQLVTAICEEHRRFHLGPGDSENLADRRRHVVIHVVLQSVGCVALIGYAPSPAGTRRIRRPGAQCLQRRRNGSFDGAAQVNMLGYCFGGFLLHAAHHPRSPLLSLSVLTTPADLQQLGPLGDVLGVGGLDVDAVLDPDGNVPPRIILRGFRSLSPTADITHLSDIKVPFLHVLANRDHIIPEAPSTPLVGLVGSPDKHELRLDAGHIGVVVGRTAAKTTIPTIIEFLKQRSEVAP